MKRLWSAATQSPLSAREQSGDFVAALQSAPWVTLAVVAVAIGTPGALEYDRAAILRGEVWRLVTAHLAHWSPDHLLWDVIAFAALGAICERRRGLFAGVIVATMLIVSLVLFFVCPEVGAYRGLSAVASALWFWAVFIVAERQVTLAFVLAALFFGKVMVEWSTGVSIFASDVAVLPSVHLIGAAVGFCGAWAERKMARRNDAALHAQRRNDHLRRRWDEPAVVGSSA